MHTNEPAKRTVSDRMQGWSSSLAGWTTGILLFETITGFAIWLLPFSVPSQWMVLVHTIAGLILVLPLGWYSIQHWLQYRRNAMSHIKLLGYGSVLSLMLLGISGLVLTWQGFFGRRIDYVMDAIHIIATFALVILLLPHVLLLIVHVRKQEDAALHSAQRLFTRKVVLSGGLLLLLIGLLSFAYRGTKMNHEFPEDYSFRYGSERPFAPSLSQTESGGAIDPRLFAGSESCGTSGCHSEITEEWEASAHRYAAMDAGFQAIQLNMATQNGPESTRYCAGCHDPISLFSGTKNIYTKADQLTNIAGYQEGVSCLVCHSIKKTDVKGNAAYVMSEPQRYLFEIEYQEDKGEISRVLRDFLIRTYPRHHTESLSKHLFKAPEYCAACHKQFIDQEINSVGWVQLQNQYDNWRKSRWNHPKNPQKTIECRECHMFLEPSTDPASGDGSDYNRTTEDKKHRSHRFLAANQFMPAVLKLPGADKQVALTHKWLRGEIEIPEIADKWRTGPAVTLQIIAPESAKAGETIDVKVVITSNKVGHDFPTGPLDIIQSWVQLRATDHLGKPFYESGLVDENGFIQPGSFIFKAEPVDQHGNLVDRHNLWEMVGVRHRRALFPGFSDAADFSLFCPDLNATGTKYVRENPQQQSFPLNASTAGQIRVTAKLCYRKVDQFLLNFMFGEESGITSPVTEMTTAERTITVLPQ